MYLLLLLGYWISDMSCCGPLGSIAANMSPYGRAAMALANRREAANPARAGQSGFNGMNGLYDQSFQYTILNNPNGASATENAQALRTQEARFAQAANVARTREANQNARRLVGNNLAGQNEAQNRRAYRENRPANPAPHPAYVANNNPATQEAQRAKFATAKLVA